MHVCARVCIMCGSSRSSPLEVIIVEAGDCVGSMACSIECPMACSFECSIDRGWLLGEVLGVGVVMSSPATTAALAFGGAVLECARAHARGCGPTRVAMRMGLCGSCDIARYDARRLTVRRQYAVRHVRWAVGVSRISDAIAPASPTTSAVQICDGYLGACVRACE